MTVNGWSFKSLVAKSLCIKEAVAHVSSIALVLNEPTATSTAGQPVPNRSTAAGLASHLGAGLTPVVILHSAVVWDLDLG